MNTNIIRTLVQQKTGQDPEVHDRSELEQHFGVLTDNEAAQYLIHCLPKTSYIASGVRVRDLRVIIAENTQEASPGQYIYPQGYTIIATSIGGNAICLHGKFNRACWANSAYFSEGMISFQDPDTGEWKEYFEYDNDSVAAAMMWFEENIEDFLVNLLSDRLTEQLEHLDH